MDARTLRVLEYDKALALLAGQAATALGKAKCLRLRPRTDRVWVEARLEETGQARDLLTHPALGTPPWRGVTDQTETLGRAGARALLTPSELLAVRDLAAGCRRMRGYFERAQEIAASAEGPAETSSAGWAYGGAASLLRLGLRLGTYPEIETAVANALTDDGEIKPDATPELARLLRLRVTLRDRLRERMEALAQTYFARGLLQDPLVVERGGRMCLPVLAAQHGRFEGIVHDRSGSGATLFMEPLAVVPQGNELRDTELAVEEEYRKVLADLSALVGGYAEALTSDLRRLTALDVIFAKGRLALLQDAHRPALGAYLDLPDARHPLLGGKAVPIDFHLGDEFTTLVITGPNTGGKTVALKTVGLLALLAQSGLHIPAGPTCKVPIFAHVFADIGDEQSLEQSLSTFSSHMSQIVKILHRVQAAARAGEGPILVLLDEIGAGTDPTEGTALAQAILEALHGAFAGGAESEDDAPRRGGPTSPRSTVAEHAATGRPEASPAGAGSYSALPGDRRSAACLTVVTTHYNELKAFAYNTPGMQNARVDFDPKTLAPTYRLLIGSPGSSNAFQIAQRLGLPRAVVSRARERVDQVGRDFARALEQVERTQADLAARRREAETAGREVARLREQHQRELAEFHAQRRQAMERGFGEAQQILREAQERAGEIIRALQRQEKHTAEAERLRRDLTEERRRLREQQEALEAEMRQAASPPYPPLPAGERVDLASAPGAGLEARAAGPVEVVVPGMRVRVADWDREGTVLQAVGDDRALVAVGAFRVEVPLGNLYPAEPQPPGSALFAEEGGQVLSLRKQLAVPAEIMLLGKTVAEATAELDKYLDDAALAGKEEVRIVHGKGTGALRQGIRAYLREHPAVESFRSAEDSEGGEGATIVRLRR